MTEEISKPKVTTLLDRVHEAKIPLILFALIIVSDVGLLLGGGKSLYVIISEGNIVPLQMFFIVLSIISFLLFNSLLALFIRLLLSWGVYSLLNINSDNKDSDYFTVGELLIYSIKYNNKTLENVYVKHAKDNNDKTQLKNIILSLLIFIGIDSFCSSSLIRQMLMNNNSITFFFIFFIVGCVIYVLIQDDDKYSSTMINKRFSTGLEKRESDNDEYLFPK